MTPTIDVKMSSFKPLPIRILIMDVICVDINFNWTQRTQVLVTYFKQTVSPKPAVLEPEIKTGTGNGWNIFRKQKNIKRSNLLPFMEDKGIIDS